MPDEIYRSPPFSAPVRNLVASASDEQLAWMVGPDRQFYSEEAIEAATWELERRRSESLEGSSAHSFEVAAFVLGPIWYFYHGMMGRGVLVAAFLLAALYGLHPVAVAAGIPSTLWVVFVLVSVGAYCGRYAARDLEESRTQARLYPREGKPGKVRHGPAPAPDFVEAAVVGCRMVGEQARALLETEGISSIVKCEDTGVFGPGGGSRSVLPARVLVPRADLERSRELLDVLISASAADPSAGCTADDEEAPASS